MALFDEGIYKQVFERPANIVTSVSLEAYPVEAASQALSGLGELVGKEYIGRLGGSLKYDDFETTMTNRKKWLGIYTGEDINSHLISKFTTNVLEEVKLASSNIVDRAIRRMALTYKDKPEYTHTGKGLPEDYPSVNRWIAFKNAERLCNLLGTVAIRPVVRGAELQWDVLWYFVPLLSENDSLQLDGIAYPLSANNKRWAIWTKEEMYIGDTGTKKKEPFPGREDTANPYGLIPFTLAHPKYPANNCPIVNGYGKQLIDANDALNLGLTETRIGARLNMMGQYWTKGLDAKNVISLGANKVPNFPDTGELNQVAPTGDFTGAIEYLRFEIENAMQSIGLQIQWGDSADAPSGESLRVKSIELIERREDDVPIWREADRGVYEDEMVIYEEDMKKKLPELERINFQEMSFPKPASETRDQLEWDWKHGFDTPAAHLMRRDPDGFKDDEEAQAFIDENKQAQPQQPGKINIFGKKSESVGNGVK